MSYDGRWVAAAVEESNDVAFVDTQAGKLAFVVTVRGKNPEHAVFSPDGRLVFVSAEEGDAVDVIDNGVDVGFFGAVRPDLASDTAATFVAALLGTGLPPAVSHRLLSWRP